MIRKTTQIKVAAAFKLLRKHGFGIDVPGCYSIDNAQEAVMFANDRIEFYKYVGSEHMLKHLGRQHE